MENAKEEQEAAEVFDRKEPEPWRSAEQVLQQLLEAAEVPRIRQLLERQDGEVFRQELVALLRGLIPDRAPRKKVQVVAKMLRLVGKQEVEDPVVVRDISASGTQLAISNRMGIDASALTRVRLRLRVGGRRDCVVDAVLVRVLRVDSQYIVAGFRFDKVDPELARELGSLEHVRSIRAKAIYAERISQSPQTMKGEVSEAPTSPRGVLGPKLA